MAYRRPKRAYPTVPAWLAETGTAQQDLAKVLGISQSHMSNVLSGKRRCSLRLALRLSKLTNVPVENIADTSRVA
jgi:antitoxin component HigA of HigAB toxin-antitoxin module